MIEAIRSLVRPVVTVAIVAALIYGFVTKLVSVEVFMVPAILIVKWWFEDRKEKKAIEKPEA